MDLLGGLVIGALVAVAGGVLVWKRHHVAALFWGGLLLAVAGLATAAAAVAGATIWSALGSAAFLVGVVLGLWLWPRSDHSS